MKAGGRSGSRLIRAARGGRGQRIAPAQGRAGQSQLFHQQAVPLYKLGAVAEDVFKTLLKYETYRKLHMLEVQNNFHKLYTPCKQHHYKETKRYR